MRITYSCGHEGRVASKEEWKAGGICPDCYCEEREQQRAKQAAEAASSNAMAGLPALTGSEKQVAWAEGIRSKALAELDAEIERAVAGCVEQYREALRAELTHRRNVIAGQTTARYWIDEGRHLYPYTVTKEAAQAVIDRTPELQARVAEAEAVKAAEEQRKQDEAAAREQERLAEVERKQAEEREREEYTAEAAGTFAIATIERQPCGKGSSSNHRWLKLRSADGRVAEGYTEYGEWVVYQIDGRQLNSLHPAAEALAARAKAMAQQAA